MQTPPHIGAVLSPVLLAAGLALAACSGEKSDSAAAPADKVNRVIVAPVVERDFAEEIEALGTVHAMEAIELSANVTERVAEIFFEDGDRVEKGAPLARLDDNEEKARLAAARAHLAEQEREITRLKSLARDGAVSEVRLEEYETKRAIALQEVEEVQAQIEDRKINAPFSGVLGFRQISPGTLVSPGDVIATLDQLDPAKLDFTAPETFLSGLKPGTELEARTQTYPDEVFKAKITGVDTRVNPVTRSLTVRAQAPNPDFHLRPGMLISTHLTRNPRKALSIPERALVSVQSSHYVFVIENRQDKRATAGRRDVRTGQRLPGFVEITEGLAPGQEVVSDGLIGLSDGAAVEITGQFDSPAEPYRPSVNP